MLPDCRDDLVVEHAVTIRPRLSTFDSHRLRSAQRVVLDKVLIVADVEKAGDETSDAKTSGLLGNARDGRLVGVIAVSCEANRTGKPADRGTEKRPRPLALACVCDSFNVAFVNEMVSGCERLPGESCRSHQLRRRRSGLLGRREETHQARFAVRGVVDTNGSV